MNEKDQKILQGIYEKYIGFYWDTDAIIRYTPRLFPFHAADQKVRDALKAINCKKDKDNRFKESRQSMDSDKDYRRLIHDLEYIFEKEGSRYKKYPDEGKRDYRDMMMMLLPIISSQKSNVNISLDINKLNENIYGECDSCPIRPICKDALAISSEYVTTALINLNFEITKKENE